VYEIIDIIAVVIKMNYCIQELNEG